MGMQNAVLVNMMHRRAGLKRTMINSKLVMHCLDFQQSGE